jgi:predicted ATP-grasp superfamily ATP-dependent carboligase
MGIKETDNSLGIRLFPNPATDFITIQSDKYIKSVHIYDYSGKLVRVIELNALQTIVSVNDLAKGFYSFIITTNDRSQKTMKLVKE